MSELRQFRRLRIRKRKHEDPENEKFKRIVKMSKEEAVLILEKAGYTAKVENSVVVAKIEKFSQKEFDRVRNILREAGYNSSFGVKKLERR